MSYSAPSADDLQERYPAFADVDDATVEYWLTDAAAECASWPDVEGRANAEMALAAHRMIETGVVEEITAKGLTSFKSGEFAATIDSAVAGRTGFRATVYGREFERLRRRYFGGPYQSWTPPTSTENV